MVTHDVGFASSFFTRTACVNREVIIHPTSELTGKLIRDMYGGDLQMIRHDHSCSNKGHHQLDLPSGPVIITIAAAVYLTVSIGLKYLFGGKS